MYALLIFPLAYVGPLKVSGSVDMDLASLSANQLMLWGLYNLWNEGHEGGYLSFYGGDILNDFGERLSSTDDPYGTPNFWEKTFPFLFPYGVGGPEAIRPRALPLKEHIQLLMSSCHHRFRKHTSFMFTAFSILQKREALSSARIQINHSASARDIALLQQLSPYDLDQARRQEEAHQKITNPLVQTLRKHVFVAGRKVSGSNTQRYGYRGQIWSTSIWKNPANWFVTLNFPDVHDPITAKFAGLNVTLDSFNPNCGPTRGERVQYVADDPYACAEYHHYLADCVIRYLFNISVSGNKVKSGPGVLGELDAVYGVWETQNRGSLHLHLLGWSTNSPTSAEMDQKLRDPEFRRALEKFIDATIRAYLPGFESKEAISAMEKDNGVAFSRMPNPHLPSYTKEADDVERRMVRSEQIHNCHSNRCLTTNRYGRRVCKRHAPFPISDCTKVEESGAWVPKRLSPNVVEYSPSVTVACRCNNNCKLMTNGTDTLNLSFYMTMYPAKKQGKDQNLSGLMADGFMYHENHPNERYEDTIQHNEELLLFRLLHTINSSQSLAAQMIVSLLMNWGDTWRSHTYTKIFWSSFVAHLFGAFPEMQSQKTPGVDVSR